MNEGQTVTLICAQGHEWQATASDTGMARPFPSKGGQASPGHYVSYDPADCPTCREKGFLKR